MASGRDGLRITVFFGPHVPKNGLHRHLAAMDSKKEVEVPEQRSGDDNGNSADRELLEVLGELLKVIGRRLGDKPADPGGKGGSPDETS